MVGGEGHMAVLVDRGDWLDGAVVLHEPDGNAICNLSGFQCVGNGVFDPAIAEDVS